MTDKEIAVSGDLWLGKKNLDSVLNMLRRVMDDADHSVKITAYSLRYSEEFFGLLENVLKKEIPVTLVINKFEDTKEFDGIRNLISRLMREYPKFVVKDFKFGEGDLHAKIVVIDHQLENCQALIGSANLSWRAIAKNHELLIKLTGEEADTIGDLFELIADKADDVK